MRKSRSRLSPASRSFFSYGSLAKVPRFVFGRIPRLSSTVPYLFRMSIASLLRFASWLAVLSIGILSLVPGVWRPHTGLPGPAEHFLAYILTGFLLATQGRTRAYWGTAAALLCLYSGSLEILQNWVPDRDPEFIDFLVSSAGAICGTAAFAMIQRLWQRHGGKAAHDTRAA